MGTLTYEQAQKFVLTHADLREAPADFTGYEDIALPQEAGADPNFTRKVNDANHFLRGHPKEKITHDNKLVQIKNFGGP